MLSLPLEVAFGLDARSRASRPSRVRKRLDVARFGIGLAAVSALTIALMLAVSAAIIPRVSWAGKRCRSARDRWSR